MEKKILVIDDGSEQVKAAIEALNTVEASRELEGGVIPIVLETRERERSRRVGPILPILSLMGMGDTSLPYALRKPEKPTKICLLASCRKEHKHNNSFCSPECCKAYKLK